MSYSTDSDPVVPFIRTCQIIVGALILGVVSFLVMVLLFVPKFEGRAAAVAAAEAKPAPTAELPPIITYVALAMGAAVLVLSFVVPNIVVSQARGRIPSVPAPADGEADRENAAALLPVFQTQLIIGAALLEGGAFFATIAFMLERNPLALGLAGILLVVLATRFPTTDRLRKWLDRQLELSREER